MRPGSGSTGLPVLRRSACTIARLHGDLDIATTPALLEQQAGMPGPGARLVIVSLSEVSFCGAAGLAMLIGTQCRARTRGGPASAHGHPVP